MNLEDPIGIVELDNINIKCLIFKVNNNNQLAKVLTISLNQNSNPTKQINRLRKIGKSVLDLTLNELNYYIKS